jgi:hypothetical protein
MKGKTLKEVYDSIEENNTYTLVKDEFKVVFIDDNDKILVQRIMNDEFWGDREVWNIGQARSLWKDLIKRGYVRV